MQFNKIIYHRLGNIACFIPEITDRDDWEQQKEFIFSLILENADSSSSIKKMASLNLSPKIGVMEVKLFLLCVRAYESLRDFFSEFEQSFPGPCSYVEDPISFYNHIISRNELPKQLIEEKSFGMFQGLRNCVRFYCNFFDSYCIYCCFKSMLPALEKLTFLSDFRNHLYSNMGHAARVKGGLMAVLFDFANLLDRYNQCADGSPDRENILNDLIAAYGEMWYNFHSVAISPPDVFCQKEKDRRTAISERKKEKNLNRCKKVEQLLKEIKKLSDGTSVRKACKNYFEEHEDYLQSLNIKSYRTLQNRLTGVPPNKLRKIFNNQRNAIPTYQHSFKLLVNELWNKTK